MPRETRPPRRERPAPQYKKPADIIREELQKGNTLHDVVLGLVERMAFVVRTDHPENRV